MKCIKNILNYVNHLYYFSVLPWALYVNIYSASSFLPVPQQYTHTHTHTHTHTRTHLIQSSLVHLILLKWPCRPLLERIPLGLYPGTVAVGKSKWILSSEGRASCRPSIKGEKWSFFLKDKTNNVYFYFVLQRRHHQIVRATKSLRPAKPEEAYGSHELPSPSGVGSTLGF